MFPSLPCYGTNNQGQLGNPHLGRVKIDQEQEESIQLSKTTYKSHLLWSQVPVKNSPDAVKLFQKDIWFAQTCTYSIKKSVDDEPVVLGPQ